MYSEIKLWIQQLMYAQYFKNNFFELVRMA